MRFLIRENPQYISCDCWRTRPRVSPGLHGREYMVVMLVSILDTRTLIRTSVLAKLIFGDLRLDLQRTYCVNICVGT